MPTVTLGRPALTVADLEALAAQGTRLRIATEARQAVRASRATVEAAVAEDRVVYGVNTGFGKLASVRIAGRDIAVLQRNLVHSHATGVGAPLPPAASRLALALRIQALALGSSGVREMLLDGMVALYHADLVPVVPALGSVGASGDLAPLAHLALPLLGEGEVWVAGKRRRAAAALRKAGIEPLELTAKEGLALINGTQIMLAIGALALLRARRLSKVADVATAMTIEALRASQRPFLEAVHRVRPHPGQVATADNLRRLLGGSEIMVSHVDCEKVQDAYSLRCAPQVHGPVKEAIGFVQGVLTTEANAVTDNPLVFGDGEVVSAGNFHGQPVSQALDFLAIAMATLANISERRIENLVNPDISGLPPFLARRPGLESGMMIPQVVAAALVSENKTLAHPASVDTVPTSANREDHVSMGVTAARHATMVVDNVARVVGIELLCAGIGLDLGEPLAPGHGVAAAHDVLRRAIRPLSGDRILAPDLEAAAGLVEHGDLIGAVERRCGSLHASA